jgi:hypothetical protein
LPGGAVDAVSAVYAVLPIGASGARWADRARQEQIDSGGERSGRRGGTDDK